jgi:nitrite reductase/ring-hydroxylating ferredoxin subunit
MEAEVYKEASSMEKYFVAQTSGWAQGERRLVRVGGVELGVFQLPGGFKAYRNFCPHAGGPVCTGPTFQAEDSLLIVCPWHGWQFDLATGETLSGASPGRALQSYAVEVADSQVYVWV